MPFCTDSMERHPPFRCRSGRSGKKSPIRRTMVVTLEIISGRANADSNLEDYKMYLLEWAWHCHEQKQEMELVDKDLSEFNEDEVRRLMGVALLCSQTSPSARPSMSRVVAMLSGDVDVPTVISRPGYLTEWNFSDITTFVMDSGNPTSISNENSYDPSLSIAMTTPQHYSPVPASEPMLREGGC